MSSESGPAFSVSAAANAGADTLRFIRNRQYALVTGSACLLTGFAGPFGTDDLLPLMPRLVYWSMIIGFATLTLTYLSFLGYRLTTHQRIHWVLTASLAGIAGTPLIFGVVVVLYRTFIPKGPTLDVAITALEVGIPAVIINVIVNAYVRLPPDYADPRKRPVAQALDGPAPLTVSTMPDDQSLFLDNLPDSLGRDVVSIRADDHYIEVCTSLGQCRILMRLRDAETALASLPGLRVHRSWWVNLQHVTALERRSGGGGLLTLDTGETVPVSRAQVFAVQQALTARG